MQRPPSQTRAPPSFLSQPSTISSSSSGPHRSNPSQAVPLSLSPTARRSSSHSFADEDSDPLLDPRPWETQRHPRQYGSLPPRYQENHILAAGDYSEKNLPMFHTEENEPRRRHAAAAGTGISAAGTADGGASSALTAGPAGQGAYGQAEGAAAGRYGEKGEPLFDVDDDQGKWMKGYGAGPGVGGRRGLPPRQRLTGWKGFYVEWEDPIWAAIYTLLSMITRYWRIGAANYVVWDEAHFGKFGSHYINRDFYFDVHPPLGKMLVGLAGLLSGYNGGFEFKSGVEYPADLPHTAMRVMLASFGVMLVPLAWWTAGEMGWSRFTRHWVTICVLCDIGWLCISRFILLDSMLLFFTFTTTLGLVKFHSQRHDPFNEDWWAWLVFTGWSIGCVCSVKWVGMFVTAMVGVYTIEDLWDKFGDLRMPVRTYIKHWAARISCLIVLPFIVYAACFKIHFLVLNRSGPGDAQMSSLFQSHLKGNDFAQSPLEVAYGSKLTLKNYGYGGGLLHSHVQTYPVGSQQQQITCYHYKDDNNNWIITPPWSAPPVDPEGEIRYLLNGDSVRLVHAATGRNLHSHAIAAPVSKEHYEVAGYGNATIGDDNDLWTVEIVDDTHRSNRDQKDGKVHSLTTRMRFKHKTLNCYLRAANAVLPQWGFKQVEVTCDKVNNPKDVHTYWNVESHWNERLPPGSAKLYKSPFWRDFAHLNVAMWTSNNALVPDPDKDDILASSPIDWPFLHLGLRMCGWGDSAIKFYLLGTPIIWWGSTIALGLSGLVLAWYVLRMQRQYKDWRAGEWEEWMFPGKVAFWGWFMHFAPFLIMGRVTYLHHYLPTLYFAVLMMGHLLDHFFFAAPRTSTGQAESYVSARPLSGPSAAYPIGSPGPSGYAPTSVLAPSTQQQQQQQQNQRSMWNPRSRSLRVRTIWFAIWAGAVIINFWWFKDLALGIHGNVNDHKGWKWRESWNIYN